MKVLQVNKFNYLRGGADKYFLAISDKLRAEGHEVAEFCMHHPNNRPSQCAQYFVSRVSFNEAKLRDKLIAPFRILYSFEAKRKFKRLIEAFKPDIIHAHNIYHQLSPSILSVAKQYNIPVIMHLHDYKLICPNYQMLCGSKICEACAAPHYYRCFFKKCFQNSYFKSLLVTLEMYLHHSILKIYEKNVDLYIAPSRFMKDICVRHGVDPERIKVMYNFIDQALPARKIKPENYILYLGRLSAEKGLPVAIEALAKTKTALNFKIAGAGHEAIVCRNLAKKLRIDNRIEMLGYVFGKKLETLIDKALAIVIPSVWYENMPFAMLEAMALGKVVIASRIGGLPELIKHGENGFLFTMGDSLDLSKILNDLESLNVAEIGERARLSVGHLTLDNHYRDLMNLYQEYVKKT